MKAEAIEAALPQPQSLHCYPVQSAPPSHFRPGVASRGIGKRGKLGGGWEGRVGHMSK